MPQPTPSRHTETRHATPGNTCTHYLSYELTCDEYDQMKERAQGRCEICSTPEAETPRGSLVIDHYQWADTFFVRGLLCDRCNAVMARHDRKHVWGDKTRPWAAKAAEYHHKSWGATAEQLEIAAAQIAARTPWTRRLSGYNPAFDDLNP